MSFIAKEINEVLKLQKKPRIYGLVTEDNKRDIELITNIVSTKGLDIKVKDFAIAVIANRVREGVFCSTITEEILNIDATLVAVKKYISDHNLEKHTDVLVEAVKDFYYDPSKEATLISIIRKLIAKKETNLEPESEKKPEAEKKVESKPESEKKPEAEKKVESNKEEKGANFDAKDVKGVLDNEAVKKIFQNKDLFVTIQSEATKFFTGLIVDDKITKEKKIEYIKYTAHSVFNLLDGIIGLGIDLSQFIKSTLSKETAEKLDTYMSTIVKSKYDMYKVILQIILEQLAKNGKDETFVTVLEFAIPTINKVIEERQTAESQTQQKPMTQQDMTNTINQLLQNRQVLYNAINQTQDQQQQQVFTYQLGEVEKLIKYYYSQLQGQTVAQNTQEAQGAAYSMEPNIFDSMINDTNANQYINNQSVGVIEYWNYMNNAYSSTRATIDQIHDLYTAQNSSKATAEDMALVEGFLKSQMDGFRQAAENKEEAEKMEAEIVNDPNTDSKDVKDPEDIPPVSVDKTSENKNVLNDKHTNRKKDKASA